MSLPPEVWAFSTDSLGNMVLRINCNAASKNGLDVSNLPSPNIPLLARISESIASRGRSFLLTSLSPRISLAKQTAECPSSAAGSEKKSLLYQNDNNRTDKLKGQ